MKKYFRIIILVIAIICFCWSAYSLINYGWETWTASRAFSSLSDLINTDTIKISENDDDLTEEEVAEQEAARMMTKYGALYEQNSDFIGWISIEGTTIDYPVMYTPDDPEYYLKRNFNGEYSSSGTLFVDYRCSFDPVSTNIIIYGHHMKSGTMFGSLINYKEEDYMEEHHTITFDTIYRSGTYEIFTAFLSADYSGDDDVFKYYNFINASTEDEFNDYIENVKALSLYYDEDNAPVYGDEIITLSTCEYSQENGRFVVLAKRVEQE